MLALTHFYASLRVMASEMLAIGLLEAHSGRVFVILCTYMAADAQNVSRRHLYDVIQAELRPSCGPQLKRNSAATRAQLGATRPRRAGPPSCARVAAELRRVAPSCAPCAVNLDRREDRKAHLKYHT